MAEECCEIIPRESQSFGGNSVRLGISLYVVLGKSQEFVTGKFLQDSPLKTCPELVLGLREGGGAMRRRATILRGVI
jgi:hypothetical protein